MRTRHGESIVTDGPFAETKGSFFSDWSAPPRRPWSRSTVLPRSSARGRATRRAGGAGDARGRRAPRSLPTPARGPRQSCLPGPATVAGAADRLSDGHRAQPRTPPSGGRWRSRAGLRVAGTRPAGRCRGDGARPSATAVASRAAGRWRWRDAAAGSGHGGAQLDGEQDLDVGAEGAQQLRRSPRRTTGTGRSPRSSRVGRPRESGWAAVASRRAPPGSASFNAAGEAVPARGASAARRDDAGRKGRHGSAEGVEQLEAAVRAAHCVDGIPAPRALEVAQHGPLDTSSWSASSAAVRRPPSGGSAARLSSRRRAPSRGSDRGRIDES